VRIASAGFTGEEYKQENSPHVDFSSGVHKNSIMIGQQNTRISAQKMLN